MAVEIWLLRGHLHYLRNLKRDMERLTTEKSFLEASKTTYKLADLVLQELEAVTERVNKVYEKHGLRDKAIQ